MFALKHLLLQLRRRIRNTNRVQKQNMSLKKITFNMHAQTGRFIRK